GMNPASSPIRPAGRRSGKNARKVGPPSLSEPARAPSRPRTSPDLVRFLHHPPKPAKKKTATSSGRQPRRAAPGQWAFSIHPRPLRKTDDQNISLQLRLHARSIGGGRQGEGHEEGHLRPLIHRGTISAIPTPFGARLSADHQSALHRANVQI